MSKIVVRIAPDGRMQYVDNADMVALATEGTVSKKRASHVEPDRWIKRQLFHLARQLFGEYGRVGNWTRRWKCWWRVNLTPSGGPIRRRFDDRADAIHWEIQWLIDNKFGTSALTLASSKPGTP